jgi:Fe-S cluster biosynthesis and repair protein YggX
MADINARIEQFRKMAEADPDNELGHFSLGRAYLDAGRDADAVASFTRALDINKNLSKVYQLLAQAHLKLGNREQAVDALTRGVTTADERGDLMVKNAMIDMLKEQGAPVPQLKSDQRKTEIGAGEVLCARCGRVNPMLPAAPFSHKMGQFIYARICAPCWREWIGMGTKVINELRLPLSDPQAQRIFDQHMLEFLNLQEAWNAEKAKQ